MFFPRLRNQAKWAFVFLIVIFAGGFIFLGVGSGGLDLGQLMRDAFGQRGASAGSISKAQKNVRAHPNSPAAYLRLADVAEKKGDTEEAIGALSVRRAAPEGRRALRHLGDLAARPGRPLLPPGPARVAQPVRGERRRRLWSRRARKVREGPRPGSDRNAVSTKLGTEFQTASTKYQTAATQAVATYQQIVKLQPKNQEALFALAQAADTLQQTTVAVGAYKKLLTLDLDATTKAQIRERIKTLQAISSG